MATNKAPVTKFKFNAAQVAPQQALDPIPRDWYVATLTECQLVPVVKNPKNTRLSFVAVVQEGDYKGRKVYGGFNVFHENAQTQAIAQEEVSAVCHAINVIDISDVRQLENKPLMIKVAIRPAEGDYEERNEIRGFKSVQKTTGGPASPASPAAAPKRPTPATAPAPAPTPVAKRGAAPALPKVKAPTPPSPPAPEPEEEALPERVFWIVQEGAAAQITEFALGDMLAGDGYTGPAMLDGDQDWSDIADFTDIRATPAAEEEEPAAAGAAPTPPWMKKK